MKVQPLQRIGHVRVLIHPPVSLLEVILHHIDAINYSFTYLPCLSSLFPVEDVRLCNLRMAMLNQHLLNDVLYLFHMRDVALFKEVSVKDKRYLISKLFSPFSVRTTNSLGSFEYGLNYPVSIKGDNATIPFPYERLHTISSFAIFRRNYNTGISSNQGCTH